LVLTGFVSATAPTAGLADTATTGIQDLLPDGAYGTDLKRSLETGDFDFAALRTLYAADPDFKGRSQLSDKAIEDLIASHTGTPAHVWTEDDVSRAILADFPLLETHHAAHEYFKVSQIPNAAKMVASHAEFYRSILDAILATRRDGPEGPVFSVLERVAFNRLHILRP
jgi:hypothetical protein